jgi:mannitol/fructose-specific phosphotransferase system IIA component (Ntr-type)
MTLVQFTEPNLLVPRLLSETHDSAIAELGGRLEKAGRISNVDAFTHAVLKHESFVSAVFDEVAFPLARGPAVNELSFALGVSSPGIRWGDGKASMVHAIVLFAVPLSAEHAYLSLVMSFSSFFKDEMAFSALRRCAQPEEMFSVLNHFNCAFIEPHPTGVSGMSAGRGK